MKKLLLSVLLLSSFAAVEAKLSVAQEAKFQTELVALPTLGAELAGRKVSNKKIDASAERKLRNLYGNQIINEATESKAYGSLFTGK